LQVNKHTAAFGANHLKSSLQVRRPHTPQFRQALPTVRCSSVWRARETSDA
jgi:hypothetical protein